MSAFWKDIICTLSVIGFFVSIYADYLFDAHKKSNANTTQSQVKDDV